MIKIRYIIITKVYIFNIIIVLRTYTDGCDALYLGLTLVPVVHVHQPGHMHPHPLAKGFLCNKSYTPKSVTKHVHPWGGSLHPGFAEHSMGRFSLMYHRTSLKVYNKFSCMHVSHHTDL